MHSNDHHKKAELALKHAIDMGADQASVRFSNGEGFSVTAQNGAIETVEDYKDQSFTVTVFLQKSIGSASSNNLDELDIKTTVDKAFSLSSLTASDDCNGLADKEHMANKVIDLDLYHPWDLDIEKAKQIAIECEEAALESDNRVVNSEGATVGSYITKSLFANSHDFIGYSEATGHTISCTAIAQQDGSMEMDYDYTSARHHEDLVGHKIIGHQAGLRAAENLGSRKIKTQKASVIFSPRVSGSLVSHIMNAISGSSLYRKSSFLLNAKDKQICPDFITIKEEPHLKRGFSSSYFDAEGVKTRSRSIIELSLIHI